MSSTRDLFGDSNSPCHSGSTFIQGNAFSVENASRLAFSQKSSKDYSLVRANNKFNVEQNNSILTLVRTPSSNQSTIDCPKE